MGGAAGVESEPPAKVRLGDDGLVLFDPPSPLPSLSRSELNSSDRKRIFSCSLAVCEGGVGRW